MLKKLLMLCLALMMSIGSAFAAVDVNTADQAALDSVKGLGPVKSKAIVDERTKNGPFKDADDLATRVKGLGTKSVAKLEENGLTIGGSTLPPTGKTSSTPAQSLSRGAAAPNSTVKSSTAATAATSPAATTAQTPATTPATTPAPTTAATTATPAAPAAPASGSKASARKAKKAAAASAAPATTAATAPAPAASEAKPSKSKRKKDKAASAAAASQ